MEEASFVLKFLNGVKELVSRCRNGPKSGWRKSDE